MSVTSCSKVAESASRLIAVALIAICRASAAWSSLPGSTGLAEAVRGALAHDVARPAALVWLHSSGLTTSRSCAPKTHCDPSLHAGGLDGAASSDELHARSPDRARECMRMRGLRDLAVRCSPPAAPTAPQASSRAPCRALCRRGPCGRMPLACAASTLQDVCASESTDPTLCAPRCFKSLAVWTRPAGTRARAEHVPLRPRVGVPLARPVFA